MEPRARLHVLSFPYESLEPLTGGREQMLIAARSPGSALVWEVGPVLRPESDSHIPSAPVRTPRPARSRSPCTRGGKRASARATHTCVAKAPASAGTGLDQGSRR